MRRTIYLPDDLAAQVDEFLEDERKLRPDLTFSALVQESLEQRVQPKKYPSMLDLAGFVDVETFESEEKAREFAGRPEDHFADRNDALALEEHVLGAAEPDAFGAKTAGGARVERRLGVGAHLHPAHRVRPLHEDGKIAGQLGFHHRDRAGERYAGHKRRGQPDGIRFPDRGRGRDQRIRRVGEQRRGG